MECLIGQVLVKTKYPRETVSESSAHGQPTREGSKERERNREEREGKERQRQKDRDYARRNQSKGPFKDMSPVTHFLHPDHSS